MNLNVVAVAALNNTLRTLEKSAEVVDEIGMADKDVQGRRRPGVAAARSHVSLCSKCRIRQLPAVWLWIRVQRCGRRTVGVSLVGADEGSGVDEYEFARRRLTAAAYGFSSWTEFREWRKRNPAAYRERSRQLLEPSAPSGVVVDLVAATRRMMEETDRAPH
jgi:hypothetical protein